MIDKDKAMWLKPSGALKWGTLGQKKPHLTAAVHMLGMLLARDSMPARSPNASMAATLPFRSCRVNCDALSTSHLLIFKPWKPSNAWLLETAFV